MVDSIGSDAIREITREVFGRDASIRCVREIGPTRRWGITETPPSTRNLLYIVELEDDPQPYVYRFSRVQDDVYAREVENYRLLAEATGVRVPTVYCLDRSRRIVPTSYVVMDYLAGKLWQFMAHPDNPKTSSRDKDDIARLVGRFYARVHAAERVMPEAGIEARHLGYAIDRLEEAASKGNVLATAGEIDLCRRAIHYEPRFMSRTLNLCLADTEVHVRKREGTGRDDRWTIAFVCDAEWVEFRDPYADLTHCLAGARPWWKLERPASELDPSEVAALPFFQGYESIRPIPYGDLLHHAAYYQLGLWAYVAMNCRTAEKRAWIRETKGALLRRLVRIVSERAHQLEPVH